MHSIRKYQLLTFVLAILIVSVRSQVCFYPDGKTGAPDVPCNQSAIDSGGHTPCCNVDNMCLDNGLCLGGGIISRGSCTDPNWGDACPQWCKNENPTGGMPFTPCDAFEYTFACNVNNSACRDANPPFYVPKGSGVILRDDQVAPLEVLGASVAMLVEPTTTLTIAQANSNNTKATVTATPLAIGGGSFTAADVAGSAVGVGAPLLVALVCMGLVIFRQRRHLKEAKQALVEREKVERGAYMRYEAQYMQPAPSFVSPVSAASTAQQQYGRSQEVDSNHINEMSNDGGLWEMEARSNNSSKPSANSSDL